jgi:metal-responsive CopG/Arc/MetJ family transcriptional regulator
MVTEIADVETISVRIPQALLASVDRAAHKLGLRRAQFIRGALFEGVLAADRAERPSGIYRGALSE